MGNPEKHVTIKEEPEEAKLPSPHNAWDAEEGRLLISRVCFVVLLSCLFVPHDNHCV